MSDHKHHHNLAGRNLKIAFFINLVFTILEFVGGVYVNSMAIISDAIHDLGDSLSLGTSWFLENRSHKKADKRFSFGYGRLSLLGALINSVVLITGSVFVIYQSVGRLIEPEHSDALGMIWFAVFGIAANGYAAWKLSGGKTMNERVVSWHLLEDVLGWVAVLIVAIVLMFYDVHYLDPALSLVIVLYVLWNVIKRLRETVILFLQGAPEDVDLEEVTRNLTRLSEVESVHHIHLWSIDGEKHVFTAHVRLRNINNLKDLLQAQRKVRSVLNQFPLGHHTIEWEQDPESCSQMGEG